MKRRQLAALSLISAAAALGIGGAAALRQTDLSAEARAAVVRMAANTEWHGPRHRRHGGGEGGFEQRTERLIGFVERTLALDGDRQAAWQALAERLRAAAAAFRRAHGNGDAEGSGAKDRLAEAERMMAAGLAALRSLRPAFDAFYDTLTPEQRRSLDAVAARHRSRSI